MATKTQVILLAAGTIVVGYYLMKSAEAVKHYTYDELMAQLKDDSNLSDQGVYQELRIHIDNALHYGDVAYYQYELLYAQWARRGYYLILWLGNAPGIDAQVGKTAASDYWASTEGKTSFDDMKNIYWQIVQKYS